MGGSMFSFHRMLLSIAALSALLLFVAPGHAASPQTLGPIKVELTEVKVGRMLELFPKLINQAAAYQGQFFGGLTGMGANPPKRMSEQELERLNDLIEKHGFRMQEFSMMSSALMSTYFVLRPAAFERWLPSEEQPQIRAILDDSAVSEKRKEELRKQIAIAQKNKGMLLAQLGQLATEGNKKAVKPHLAKVERVLRRIQTMVEKGGSKKSERSGARSRR